jgi:NAD(P)H-dependent FMN reductase
MPRLGLIIASTRPGRIGLPVANWIQEVAEAHGGFEISRLDLAEVDLPMYDESRHPRFREYAHQHTKDWSAQIAACDAFVVVHPEYNNSFNAAIKNAIDYLSFEWNHKPIALVSYGGVAAGTRAAQALKHVFAVLQAPVVETLPIPFVARFVKDGVLEPNDVMRDAAPKMLDGLARYADALVALRED